MGFLTTDLKSKILNHVFGGPDFVRDATLYIRLTTTAPTQGANGTEVSTSVWTNYAPEAVTNNSTNFPNTATNSKSNGADIDFGDATTTGDVNLAGFEVWTASSGGTRRGAGTLTKTVTNGDNVKFAVGALVISIVDPA